jgi:hypothetical protein
MIRALPILIAFVLPASVAVGVGIGMLAKIRKPAPWTREPLP